jgi:hypothetical protein
MTRIGRDSTIAADIPVQGTQLAMGYVNGRYAWSVQDWARFPDAGHVTIDVNGHAPTADVLDVESGDASVSQAPSWAKLHNRASSFPAVIYCSRDILTPLFNAMDANGLRIGHDFKIWIATLDGTRTVADMTGVVAVQYAGELGTGGHYDESIVYDDTWKPVNSAPTPPAHTIVPSPPGEWLDGTFTGRGLNGRLYVTIYDAASGHWTTPAEEA